MVKISLFYKCGAKVSKKGLYFILFFVILKLLRRAYSSSLLRVIIACNHLPFLKIFSNFVYFYQNFQVFCPFSTFCCPFSEKWQPCPYFLEQALLKEQRLYNVKFLIQASEAVIEPKIILVLIFSSLFEHHTHCPRR